MKNSQTFFLNQFLNVVIELHKDVFSLFLAYFIIS